MVLGHGLKHLLGRKAHLLPHSVNLLIDFLRRSGLLNATIKVFIQIFGKERVLLHRGLCLYRRLLHLVTNCKGLVNEHLVEVLQELLLLGSLSAGRLVILSAQALDDIGSLLCKTVATGQLRLPLLRRHLRQLLLAGLGLLRGGLLLYRRLGFNEGLNIHASEVGNLLNLFPRKRLSGFATLSGSLRKSLSIYHHTGVIGNSIPLAHLIELRCFLGVELLECGFSGLGRLPAFNLIPLLLVPKSNAFLCVKVRVTKDAGNLTSDGLVRHLLLGRGLRRRLRCRLRGGLGSWLRCRLGRGLGSRLRGRFCRGLC